MPSVDVMPPPPSKSPITSSNTNFQTGTAYRAGGVASGSLPATFPAGASDLGGSGGGHIIYTRIA